MRLLRRRAVCQDSCGMADVENKTTSPKVPLMSLKEKKKKSVLQPRVSGAPVFFVLWRGLCSFSSPIFKKRGRK